jgi:sensor histidine kinase YesM
MAGLYLRLRERVQKAEMEKRLAELSYLKAQINPHFLFNTFNNLYALAVKESASKTADGMLKLSDMMRYIVSEASAELVMLQREIDYINDFIALQRLRINDEVKVTFTVNGVADNLQISPLILMPFIENAFKHGVNPDEKSEIEIRIDIEDNSISLHIKNRKVAVQQDQNGKLGFGIQNTKNRLDLVYPGRYTLEMDDHKDWYTVHLHIHLV